MAKVLVHHLTAGNYGYFRDELYYVAAGDRLGFGNVDFPLVALVAELVARGFLAFGTWLSMDAFDRIFPTRRRTC